MPSPMHILPFPSLLVIVFEESVQTSIRSAIEWLREGRSHRCISQLIIFSSLLYLRLCRSNCLNNIIIAIRYYEWIYLPIVVTSELYVYTVLTIDIILPTTSMNYTTALISYTDIWSLPFSYPKMYAFLPFFFRWSSVHLGVRKG